MNVYIYSYIIIVTFSHFRLQHESVSSLARSLRPNVRYDLSATLIRLTLKTSRKHSSSHHLFLAEAVQSELKTAEASKLPACLALREEDSHNGSTERRPGQLREAQPR